MKKISIKAQAIEPSKTLEINAIANDLKKKGHDVISLSVGEPDFNTPDYICDAAIEAIHSGHTKYTAVSGIAELRTAIANNIKEMHGITYTPDQIIVSTGAKQSLSLALSAILNPGDEVLLPSPYWISYPEMIKLADGKPVIVETSAETAYKVTPEILDQYTTDATKALILNAPSNPTGVVYTRDELKALADWAVDRDVFVVSDEIYEVISYGEKCTSIAEFGEAIKERTIMINGFSKAYAMTGWRLGYAAADSKIVKLMTAMQSHLTSNASTISQYAGLAALTSSKAKEVEQKMVAIFLERRNRLMNLLDEMPDIDYIKPEGAFYFFVNVSAYYGKKIGDRVIQGSIDFAAMLLAQEQIAITPGLVFGDDDFVRISYATDLETLEVAMSRFKSFLDQLH